MAVRKSTQIGETPLKASNKIVKDVSAPKIKQVIQDLKDTMYDAQLIGMASPNW